MNRITADKRSPFVIVRKNSAAVAIAPQWLGRKKACCSCIAKTAYTAAIHRAAKALRPIFQQEEAIFFADSFNAWIISRQAKQIYCYHSAQVIFPLRFYLQYCFFQFVWVKVESALVHVHKQWGRALKRHRFSTCKEGEIWHQDGITRPNSPSHQYQR